MSYNHSKAHMISGNWNQSIQYETARMSDCTLKLSASYGNIEKDSSKTTVYILVNLNPSLVTASISASSSGAEFMT